MKRIHHILALSLLLLSSVVVAQQESVYTFYRQHMNLVNPAVVGINNATVITTTLRKQWLGVAEAPETQAVSFGTYLGKNVGLGMTVINDKTFIEKQTNFSIDFSYKLKKSETADVYFGIKAGGTSYDLNASGLETYNVQSDPALVSVSNFSPNVGVGALYKEGSLYVSLSIPRLFKTKSAINDHANGVTNSPHIYLSGGYDLPLKSTFLDLILKPSAMVRYVNGAPVLIDFTTMLQIEKLFDLGAMYRTDKTYAAISTIRLSKFFVFGFAYEMSTQSTLATAKNTNEILLQFKF